MRFLRKLHKWVSLLIGLQVLLWLLSGLMMSLLDPEKVSGRAWAPQSESTPATLPRGSLLEPGQLPPGLLVNALGIQLEMVRGRAVYRISRVGGQTLVDGRDGSVIRIDRDEAERLAHQDFNGRGDIVSIEAGTAPDLETRTRSGPYWRVDFSDPANTSVYLSAASGEILERRNSHWRAFDFFWMLHIMDYSGRQNFNNALIVVVALIAIWLGISGFILLFSSFRRRDFDFFKISRIG